MKCTKCGNEIVFYMTKCDEFEAAIRKFGVDNALEYFGTPDELMHLFDSLKQKK